MVLFLSGINREESVIDSIHLYDAFEWIIAADKILNSLYKYNYNTLYKDSIVKINAINNNINQLLHILYNNDDIYYQYNIRSKISQYTYAKTIWRKIQDTTLMIKC